MAEQGNDTRRGTAAGPSAGNGASGGPASAGAADRRMFFAEGSEMTKPLAEMGRTGMEALVGSSRPAARAGESVVRETSEYGRKSFDDAFAMARSLTEARSPADLINVQTRFVRSAFENAMALTTGIGEALAGMAKEVSASTGSLSQPKRGSDGGD